MSRSRHCVAVLGAFGIQNFGNDASLEALRPAIAEHRPDAAVVCVSSDPSAVASMFWLEGPPLHAVPGPWSSRLSRWRPLRILARGPLEMARWARAYRFLRSVDTVVVAGTGILDDQHTRPGGPPWDLLLWCSAARAARARVLMLSVGAGPIDHPLSRVLLRGAAACAAAVTYRDQASLDFMASIGRRTRNDAASVDLVFALDVPASDPPPGAPVAVGVMSGWNWPGRPEAFAAYLDRVTALVRRLVEGGRAVTLIIGDEADLEARADVASRLTDLGSKVTVADVASFDDVIKVVEASAAVVASRYHNVVAALLADRPVVSLEYSAKNRALLRQFGLEQYGRTIDDFDPDDIAALVTAAIDKHDPGAVREQLAVQRAVLSRQAARLLGPATAARR